MHTAFHYSVLFLLKVWNKIGGEMDKNLRLWLFHGSWFCWLCLKMLPAGLDKGLSLKSGQLAEYLKGLNPIDISVFFLK